MFQVLELCRLLVFRVIWLFLCEEILSLVVVTDRKKPLFRHRKMLGELIDVRHNLLDSLLGIDLERFGFKLANMVLIHPNQPRENHGGRRGRRAEKPVFNRRIQRPFKGIVLCFL